jgi:hypothetical protein
MKGIGTGAAVASLRDLKWKSPGSAQSNPVRMNLACQRISRWFAQST